MIMLRMGSIQIIFPYFVLRTSNMHWVAVQELI